MHAKETDRLESFSDAVFAILITIMVLELREPSADSLYALAPVVPVFLSYALSFVFLGIYWSNHHHLLRATKKISAGVMWANLHLLFWLSLVPFATMWLGRYVGSTTPVLLYDIILLLCACAYWILQGTILRYDRENAALARIIRHSAKGRVSIVLYALAVPSVFLSPWLSYVIYVFSALLWVVPDRRLEEIIRTS